MQTVGGISVGVLVLNDFIQMASGTEFLFAPVLEGGLIIVLFTLIGVGIYLVRLKTR
jgi:hypothetical protein